MYFDKDLNIISVENGEEVTIKAIVNTIAYKEEFLVTSNKNSTGLITKNIVIDGIRLVGGIVELQSLLSPTE